MKRIIASLMLLLSTVGFSQAPDNGYHVKIKSAKKLAKKFKRKKDIPGMAISVSQKGQIIWSEGFGYSSKKPKIKVKPDTTIFRIASISKSITALSLAKLAEYKLVDLDSSIYKYVPDYPKKEYDFTVRQLGGNLAGIRHYKDDNEYALNKKMSITEGLSLFKNDSLLFQPGTKFNYTSFGYVLLSEIIQKASNKPFDTYVHDSIFKPLKMEHSMMDISDANIPNKTQFYRSAFLKKPILAEPVANEFKVGGGGFLSTSEDIIKFGNEIIYSKIISKDAIKEIITSQQLTSGNKTGYGIGFSTVSSIKGTPKYYHTGGGVGASTILMVYPEEELVITVLTNLTGVTMQEFGNALESIFIN